MIFQAKVTISYSSALYQEDELLIAVREVEERCMLEIVFTKKDADIGTP